MDKFKEFVSRVYKNDYWLYLISGLMIVIFIGTSLILIPAWYLNDLEYIEFYKNILKFMLIVVVWLLNYLFLTIYYYKKLYKRYLARDIIKRVYKLKLGEENQYTAIFRLLVKEKGKNFTKKDYDEVWELYNKYLEEDTTRKEKVLEILCYQGENGYGFASYELDQFIKHRVEFNEWYNKEKKLENNKREIFILSDDVFNWSIHPLKYFGNEIMYLNGKVIYLYPKKRKKKKKTPKKQTRK